MHLTKDCRQCQLVAAAAATCSRPEALKPFLYLDFMDQRKHHTVWDMLMQTVGKLGLQGLTSKLRIFNEAQGISQMSPDPLGFKVEVLHACTHNHLSLLMSCS